jgi:hypothetical protein
MKVRSWGLDEPAGRAALPLAEVATVAAFSGKQRPPGRDERRNQRLEKPIEGDFAVGLTGQESAVDGCEREARELVSGRAARIVPERDRDGFVRSGRDCRAGPLPARSIPGKVAIPDEVNFGRGTCANRAFTFFRFHVGAPSGGKITPQEARCWRAEMRPLFFVVYNQCCH